MNRREDSSRSGARSGVRRGPVRRILVAPSRYVDTVTPYSGQCFGIALPIFVATVVASVLYAISLILILATDCKFTPPVAHFFSFLLLALLSTIAMSVVSISYPKNEFQCVNLTASLLYAGSAALVLFGLIYISTEGLCTAQRTIAVAGSSPDTTRLPPPAVPTGPWMTTNQPWPYDVPTTNEDYDEMKQTAFSAFPLAARTNQTGLWTSKYAPNYCIWVFSAIGCCFQIAAFFYYGWVFTLISVSECVVFCKGRNSESLIRRQRWISKRKVGRAKTAESW